MEPINIPIDQLKEAPWNTNQMDPKAMLRLKESIQRFGLVQALVVRAIGNENYETIGGNMRLKLLKEMGFTHAPCFIVTLDDSHARLLGQVLNHLHGIDAISLRGELIKEVLQTIPESEVLSMLPETVVSLQSLTSIGQQDMASYLQNWERAKATRLNTMQFRLSSSQQSLVEEALSKVMPMVSQAVNNPNTRGNALFLLCQKFLERSINNE